MPTLTATPTLTLTPTPREVPGQACIVEAGSVLPYHYDRDNARRTGRFAPLYTSLAVDPGSVTADDDYWWGYAYGPGVDEGWIWLYDLRHSVWYIRLYSGSYECLFGHFGKAPPMPAPVPVRAESAATSTPLLFRFEVYGDGAATIAPLTPAPAFATPTPEDWRGELCPECDWYITVVDRLRLRACAGTACAVLETLPMRYVVGVERGSDQLIAGCIWTHVIWTPGGAEGWSARECTISGARTVYMGMYP